jgi:hypothetical protein
MFVESNGTKRQDVAEAIEQFDLVWSRLSPRENVFFV